MIKVSRVRKRKAEVLQFLQDRNLDAIIAWAQKNDSSLRILFNLTFHSDDLIKWRAIEAIGKVAKATGDSAMEKVRIFIRGLFWLMNDESGGVGWHAPEAIAEILFNIPSLLREYGRLLPQYLIEEPFERGTFFALARLGALDPGLVDQSATILVDSFNNPDPAIRGYSLLALSTLQTDIYSEHFRKLSTDKSTFTTYDSQTGTLSELTVGHIAQNKI